MFSAASGARMPVGSRILPIPHLSVCASWYVTNVFGRNILLFNSIVRFRDIVVAVAFRAIYFSCMRVVRHLNGQNRVRAAVGTTLSGSAASDCAVLPAATKA